LVIRNVDNFLTYLSELLFLIYEKYPKTLKSNDQVRVEDILEYESMEDLVGWLVDKKITELSYAGLDKVKEEVSKKHNFDLFPDVGTFEKINQFVGLRTLFVHNRGVVNRRFISKYRSSGYTLKQKVNLDGEGIISWLDVILGAAIDIDKRAVEKFGLSTIEIPDLNK